MVRASVAGASAPVAFHTSGGVWWLCAGTMEQPPGTFESILGPHVRDREEGDYLLELLRDMDKGRLDARVGVISAAILGMPTLDVQAFM